jgi:uncharacterized membrane protein YesL
MKMILKQIVLLLAGLMLTVNAHAAADSYRFLHVTIDTPWAIFIFLLAFIMIPFVLMAMLYWHFAFKKSKEEAVSSSAVSQPPTDNPSE